MGRRKWVNSNPSQKEERFAHRWLRSRVTSHWPNNCHKLFLYWRIIFGAQKCHEHGRFIGTHRVISVCAVVLHQGFAIMETALSSITHTTSLWSWSQHKRGRLTNTNTPNFYTHKGLLWSTKLDRLNCWQGLFLSFCYFPDGMQVYGPIGSLTVIKRT